MYIILTEGGHGFLEEEEEKTLGVAAAETVVVAPSVAASAMVVLWQWLPVRHNESNRQDGVEECRQTAGAYMSQLHRHPTRLMLSRCMSVSAILPEIWQVLLQCPTHNICNNNNPKGDMCFNTSLPEHVRRSLHIPLEYRC